MAEYKMLLKERRLEAGMSQRRLAMASGVSRVRINEIENGATTIMLPTVASLATALNCKMADLFVEV